MTRKEFDHISAELRGRVLATVRRIGKNGELFPSDEDIVQETLSALWQIIEKGYPVRNTAAMAITIARNICIAGLRKKTAKRTDLADFAGGYSATENTDISDVEITRSILLRELTPTQREYLELRYEEELSLDEIAERTGRRKSSVKTTISIARKQLLERLKKDIL
ncbi:MAG TPA: sigma-70 family RNA polymerase sigma factor [Candidatus Coprenecus stercoripullorum]|nr:sigma-70 family RNA polymerase sigma factor [Candidatus Coprenecus stercoripullorum]